MKYAAFLLSCLVLIVVFSIHVKQWILRHRAEQLLSDIRSLELRKTRFENVQTLFHRWKRAGEYDGECNEKHCTFKVRLQNSMFGGRVWPRRAIMMLGGRPARVLAGIEVQNGVVWDKFFVLEVEVPPYKDVDGHSYEYTLIGDAETRSRFNPPRFYPDLEFHPNYVIGRPSGCAACIMVYLDFTPYADPEDVQRLMQFNLACLTRWRPCREEADIMPVAWSQYLEESAQRKVRSQAELCTPQFVELLGRDAENAAIVDVIANHFERGAGGDAFQVSTVRLAERLKRATFWNLGNTRELRVFDGTVALGPTNNPSEVHSGTKFVILFAHAKWGGPDGPDVWLEHCGALPLTENNLAMVRRGISQDYRAARPEQEQSQAPQ